LHIKENGIYVDATTGGGGHSSLILSKLKNGHLYCFDQDEYAFTKAKEKLDLVGSNYTFVHSNFVNIKSELKKLGVDHIDGIIYDLGVSSFQLDIQERGFSYRLDAPLDMRMNQAQELSAYTIVNEYSYEEIVKILYRYGEEPFSKQIARAIESSIKIKPIETTLELVDIIKRSMPVRELRDGHPARKAFQAIRIEVNHELDVLERALEQAIDLIDVGGRICVITFHSLEDRIVKNIFRKYSEVDAKFSRLPYVPDEYMPKLKIISKGITPSNLELEENNRARSSRLRVVEKIRD